MRKLGLKKWFKKRFDSHFESAGQIPKFYNWFQGTVLTWSFIVQAGLSLIWILAMWWHHEWYMFLGWGLHFWFVVRPIFLAWRLMGGRPKYSLREGIREIKFGEK
jgi:hypothetical protein